MKSRIQEHDAVKQNNGILGGRNINKDSRYITKVAFEKVLNQIHLDTTGKVVEPFEELSGNSKKDNDDDYAIMSGDY